MWETSRLETERLLLRSLADKDAISISKIAGDFRIADTTISIPHPYSLDIAKEYIAKQKNEQKKRLLLRICDRTKIRVRLYWNCWN